MIRRCLQSFKRMKMLTVKCLSVSFLQLVARDSITQWRNREGWAAFAMGFLPTAKVAQFFKQKIIDLRYERSCKVSPSQVQDWILQRLKDTSTNFQSAKELCYFLSTMLLTQCDFNEDTQTTAAMCSTMMAVNLADHLHLDEGLVTPSPSFMAQELSETLHKQFCKRKMEKLILATNRLT